MELLKTLKFIRGAVSNKASNLEMKHFVIENKQIRATNGVLSLGSPIDLDFACSPLADTFFKAIGNCNDVVSMHITDGGRLRVKSGAFSALVPCLDDMTALPHPKPSGRRVDFPNILEALKAVEPFVCRDDLRPWTNGILLKDKSAFATNNACLVEHWIGVDIPHTVNIPLAAVKEFIRVGVEPHHVMMDENSLTFMYENGQWIKTQLYETNWPPFTQILDHASDQKPIPEALFDAVKSVQQFCVDDKNIFFTGGKVQSSQNGTDGASYQVEGTEEWQGLYRAEHLLLLEEHILTADFTRFPEPVLFFGPNIRGAMLGRNV